MIDPISAIVAATTVVNELSVLLASISAFLTKLGVAAASAVSICAVIAKYVPPPEEGSKFAKLYKLINTLGQNAGYAENK
jgi:hypothetical protein